MNLFNNKICQLESGLNTYYHIMGLICPQHYLVLNSKKEQLTASTLDKTIGRANADRTIPVVKK